MDETARAALEQDVRDRCARGDVSGAATAAIRGYGPEILGFLVALHRDEEDARDVFSTFGEALWRGLPTFAWACSLRTWAYTIARNASTRHRKTQKKRSAGRTPLSAAGELAEQVRTATLTYLKTEQKDRFAALRASLPPEDQELLILRVDRNLAWEEIARIVAEGGEAEAEDAPEPSPEALKRESARLRKRFQLVKEKLLEMGKRAGLLPSKE